MVAKPNLTFSQLRKFLKPFSYYDLKRPWRNDEVLRPESDREYHAVVYGISLAQRISKGHVNQIIVDVDNTYYFDGSNDFVSAVSLEALFSKVCDGEATIAINDYKMNWERPITTKQLELFSMFQAAFTKLKKIFGKWEYQKSTEDFLTQNRKVNNHVFK